MLEIGADVKSVHHAPRRLSFRAGDRDRGHRASRPCLRPGYGAVFTSDFRGGILAVVRLESNIFGIIALFAVLHSVVIGLFLTFQSGKRGTSALLLGIGQIAGAVLLLSALPTNSNLFELFPWLIGVPYPFAFAYGLFYFLYIDSLLEDARSSLKRFWWLFLGPAAGIALFVPFLLMDGAARDEYLLFVRLNHFLPVYDWYVWLVTVGYNLALPVVAQLRIVRYRKALMAERSNTEGIDLSLMSRLLWSLFVCWIVIALLCIVSFDPSVKEPILKAATLFPAFHMTFIGYSCLLGRFPTVRVEPVSNPLEGKMTEERLVELYAVIRREMEENEHHLNPELTLPMLAEKTSFFRNELSEVINSQSGLSFYHFVNSYRIDHFKKLLLKAEDSNILDLAFASGFNSKGAFYNAFKRITGITPRQYLDSTSG